MTKHLFLKGYLNLIWIMSEFSLTKCVKFSASTTDGRQFSPLTNKVQSALKEKVCVKIL